MNKLAPIRALGSMLQKSAKPRKRERQIGDLDGNGICPDCGRNYSANVGVYHCFACSED